MQWTKMCEELIDHPKTFKLMDLAKLDLDQALGKLFRFWRFVGRYAEDGDLRRFNPRSIDTAVGFMPNENGDFLTILIATRFVDTKPFIRVHDWYKHAGDFLRKKYSNTDDSDRPVLIKRLYKSTRSSRSGNRSGTGTETGREPATALPCFALPLTDTPKPPQVGAFASLKKTAPEYPNTPGTGGSPVLAEKPRIPEKSSRALGTNPRSIARAHAQALLEYAKRDRDAKKAKEQASTDTVADMTDAERDASLRQNAPQLWVRKHLKLGHSVDVDRLVVIDESSTEKEALGDTKKQALVPA